ncbi:MAG: rhodanese-like domain-containing protein [SAR324 cluster bacterium]|nr:rhodanese-like domain-containing protein [SAR324 cluster bacterium]
MKTEITVIEARDLIKSDTTNNFQLIDVRTKEVFDNEYIPGFINIPLNELSQKFDKLDGRKRTLLICKDGSQSSLALKLIESCGFSGEIIRGGLDDWKRIIQSPLEKAK